MEKKKSYHTSNEFKDELSISFKKFNDILKIKGSIREEMKEIILYKYLTTGRNVYIYEYLEFCTRPFEKMGFLNTILEECSICGCPFMTIDDNERYSKDDIEKDRYTYYKCCFDDCDYKFVSIEFT